ncbi:MAG: hypothetical protein IJL17_04890 [Kiritimatiellae bacterium]|nr:hypothetical protein [Kiritimatiellia bacterium]
MKRSLIWRKGTLWTEGPGEEPRAWTRPADLAQARLGTDAALESLAVADGRDMLTFAFTVAPFARGPFPEPAFGEAVTPAARAAFRVFLGLDGAGDAFHVLRGEPDDFLVFARRSRGDRPTGATWQVGGFTVDATTLTVRFEDVWDRTPPALRATSYAVGVLRDGENAILSCIAPDARLFIDLAANGGFLFTFTPEEAAR